MRCVIFGAAPCFCVSKIKKIIKKTDYVICADGGFNTAMFCGIEPDICVGDMDSISGKVNDSKTRVVKLPCKKDETDLMYAVKLAESKGASEIILFGVFGGRIDHTFGNLCVLKYLCEKKIKHKAIAENFEMLMASSQTVNLQNNLGSLVSVFPFGCHSCAVTYSGLEFPAESKTLLCNNPVGISNVVCSSQASIRIESGTALIVVYSYTPK